jgi:hypothetical protein
VRSDGAKYAFEIRVDGGEWVLGDAYAAAASKTAVGVGGDVEWIRKLTESPRVERQRIRARGEVRTSN